MLRLLQFGLIAAAFAGIAVCDQKSPPKAGHAAERPAPPPHPRSIPKAAPPAGPRLSNPANPVSRLYQSSPEERERALEKLPPRMQDRFRQNLAWFDGLPKPQQEIVVRRSERFAALTPERRKEFLDQMRALNQMTAERRRPIVQALRRLQMMPDAGRAAVLDSEQFKSRFSPEEQRMITDLSAVMLPPL